MEKMNLLREGIAAVKAGQRQYARELFLELVELEPTHELAWVWLSGLLESREEQIKALENSIAISKGGARVERRLHQLGEPEVGSELAKFRKALKVIERGNKHQGRTLLEQLLAENRDHERAWLALSELAESDEERVSALDNVLRINPNNFKAREKLTATRHELYQNYLQLGRAYQQKGELRKAVQAYQSAERYASTGSFRAAAQQRWKLIEYQSQYAQGKTSRPTFTLLRLASGPPLIYMLLIFLQSGLDFRAISLASYLGIVVVAVGSLLMIASTHTPHHPLWIVIWGEKGLTDARNRFLLRNLGILIMLLPFVFWLISAIRRFNQTGDFF